MRIVFPLAAGGGGDVFTRALADELQKAWHQPVVVENRPGGGQNIGARACAEAAPDGYTICVMSSEPAVYNQFLYKTIPYDPEKDFQPISNLFFNTLAGGHQRRDQGQDIRRDDRDGEGTRPASSATRTFSFPATVFMDKLNKAENIDIVKVPYRGGGEVVNARARRHDADRRAGAVQHGAAAAERPHHAAGGGRQFALAAVSRRADAQGGAPGEEFPTTWFGLFTQAGVPRPIVEKIARDVDRIMAEPAFRKRMYTDRGVEPARRAARCVRPLRPRGAQDRAADRQGVRAGAEMSGEMTPVPALACLLIKRVC